MQYILTQEEMDAQREKLSALERLPSIDDLQTFCSFVADNLILANGWRAGTAWGCILTSKHEWYCDDCPAQKVCPYPDKKWSK